jgi:catechol 2,3-dioxygenase-like lactoylglutathione lyase family enzyme
MHVEQVDFVSVPTRDYDRAVVWYRDVFGLPVSEFSESEAFSFSARKGRLRRPHFPRARSLPKSRGRS